jgi:hypothetical protein
MVGSRLTRSWKRSTGPTSLLRVSPHSDPILYDDCRKNEKLRMLVVSLRSGDEMNTSFPNPALLFENSGRWISYFIVMAQRKRKIPPP